MERRALALLVLITGGVLAWLVWDQIVPLEIDYKRHYYLIDQKTGAKIKPKDYIGLKKVISQSEEYINKTNSLERLHDLIQQLNIEHAFPLDHLYSSKESLLLSGQPVANQTKCGQDLSWIIGKLEENPKYELLVGKLGQELTQLIDVIGKPMSGIYAGLSHWQGSYENCQKLSMRQNSIRMRFCWSRFKSKYWPEEETGKPQTVIRVGTCLPESCDTQSSSEYGAKISKIIQHDWQQSFKEDLQFDSMYCLPDERSPLRQIPSQGRVFLAIALIWIVMVLGGSLALEIIRYTQKQSLKRNLAMASCELTIIEKMPPYKTMESDICANDLPIEIVANCCWQSTFLEAISLRMAVKNFKLNRFHVDYKHNSNKRPRVDLGSLNFLKLAMCLCVIIGHSFFISGLYGLSLSDRVRLTIGPMRSLMAFGRFVDTFFTVFGIFASYHLLSKFKEHQLGNLLVWLYYNVKTFLRVTPLFAIVYCFARYVSPYIGSGPWWDYGTEKWSLRGMCMEENLWKILPYFTSFSKIHSLCVPPGWFLVVYLQLALIIPAIIYVIYKIPNRWFSGAFVGILLLASNAQFALRLVRQDTIDGDGFIVFGGFVVSMIEKFQSMAPMSTFSHIGIISISCFFGYLLHMFKVGKISKWPDWLRSIWTMNTILVLHLVLMVLPLISPHITDYLQSKPTIEQVALFNYILSAVWLLLNCLLILQLSTVFNHLAFARFLCHPFWSSLNQLGLCMYLIHWEVILHIVQGNEYGPPHATVAELLRLSSHVFLITLIISAFVYFFFESPITALLTLVSNAVDNHFAKPKNQAQIKKLETTETNSIHVK